MRKLIVTLFLSILYMESHAQLDLTAGMNLAKYSYSEQKFDVHRKSVLAYNFGIQYKKGLTEKLYLLPEISYSLKGSRVYYDYPIGFTGPMKNVNKFHYLQFNLPTVLAMPVSDDIDFEIGGGLFLAYLLKATQKTVEFDDTYVQRDYAKSTLKKMDVGLRFTTGFTMGKKLGLHINYDLGLSNIQGHTSDPIAKTRNFSINLSWLFSKSE